MYVLCNIAIPTKSTLSVKNTRPGHSMFYLGVYEAFWENCFYIHIILMYVLCVFSSHLFWASSSLDVPAGVTQEEGHTGFLIRLPSAVRALIFLARRIQPFLSLVDREVEFCVLIITI